MSDDDFRRDLAARVLLAMIDNGGDKADKVRAAVEYAAYCPLAGKPLLQVPVEPVT
jgi:hypothetical protein